MVLSSCPVCSTSARLPSLRGTGFCFSAMASSGLRPLKLAPYEGPDRFGRDSPCAADLVAFKLLVREQPVKRREAVTDHLAAVFGGTPSRFSSPRPVEEMDIA